MVIFPKEQVLHLFNDRITSLGLRRGIEEVKTIRMENHELKRNVFISYSRHDYIDEYGNVIPQNCVSKILETLDKNDITYWIDKEGIYSGAEFRL